MTYSEGLKETSPMPYILLEIDQFSTQTMFTAYQAGIWCIGLTLLEEPDLPNLFVPIEDDPYNKQILNVNSIQVTDNAGVTVEYTRTSNITDLQTFDKRFFYDITTTNLCISFEDFDPWYIFPTIELGLSLGYCHTTNENGYTDENGITYSPRMINVAPIRETMDRIFFGTIQTNASSITLLNDNGDLDTLATSTIYGNPARVKLGFSEDALNPPLSTEFQTMFSGRVDDIPETEPTKTTISLRDERAFLTDPIPNKSYSATDYTDIDSDLEGQKIRLAFGECRNVPVDIVNKEGTAPWICKICDTDFDSDNHYDIKEITQVYIDGVAVTESNPSLVNATFELSTAQVKDGDLFKTVTADIKGYEDGSGNLYENPLDILEKLILAYSQFPFTTDYYNVNRWNSTKTQAYDINRVIEDSDLIKEIQLYATSIQGMFKIDRDGKFNFIISNDANGAVKSIVSEEFLQDPGVDPKKDQVISTMSASYNREWHTQKSRRVENTTYENEVFTNYRIKKEEKIDTVLADKADAVSLLETSMLRNKQIQPQYTSQTAHQNFDIQLGDNINIEIDRIDKPWIGNIKGEVEGIDLDLENLKTNLRVRYIENIDEEETEYVQGIIYGDVIYNDKIYGVTEEV
jgi:hypothetical protein